MVLPDTKKVLVINAGHYNADNGAVSGDYMEALEAAKVRDVVVPMLEARGYTVHAVPDHLDLRASIAWANEKAPELNDALAIDIHLNALNKPTARGTESFYGKSDTSKKIAASLAKYMAKNMGIPNRGAKPDTQTYVGSLGWIRQTKMWATLIEVCFITNAKDMNILRGTDGYKKAARGIADAVDDIFGVDPSGVPEVAPEYKTLADYTMGELFAEIRRRVSLFS